MSAPQSWSRAILPPGVAVDALAFEGDDRLTVWLAFAAAAARELGVEPGATLEATLPLAPSFFSRLPVQPVMPASLQALAAILRDAGVTTTGIAALADAHDALHRRLDEQRVAEEQRRHAEARAAYERQRPGDLERFGAELGERLRAAGLGECEADLRHFARVAVAACEAGAARAPRVGGSRLGGAPDLPPGQPWPAIDGELLSLVLQLDLAEVPAAARGPLPAEGLLSLFLGRNESTTKVEHRLVLSPPGPLRRCRPPKEPIFRDDQTGLLTPVALRFEAALSLPDYDSDEHDAIGERHPAFADAPPAYFELQRGFKPAGVTAWLCGHAAGADAARNAAAAATPPTPKETAASDWLPLLRVDSNRTAGLTFWDAGELDVLVRRPPPGHTLDAAVLAASYAEITTG